METPSQVVHLGAITGHLWHAFKHLGETVFAPLGLFYVMYVTTGLTGGLIAALVWGVGAVAVRAVLRVRIPMVLLITTGILVLRTIVGFATGSSFPYFLEPSLQNFLVALLFLGSLLFERSLIAKLADDFCLLPPSLFSNARVQRFFRRVSLLWALVFTINGLTTLWALAQATLGHFLLASTAGSFSLVALAAVASVWWLRRELRGEGITLRFSRKAAPAA